MTALAGYGLNCGRDCSVGGALSAAGSGALAGGVGGAAFGALGGLRARGRSSSEEPAACPIHSFLASTKVLLADGSSKPISALKVGDRISNSQPGKAGLEAHPVDRVIKTETDHDFVNLKVKPNQVRRAVRGVVAGLAAAAAVVTGGATTASASTLTTTYHHPFYDVTRGEFVEAVNLQVDDRLQMADGGEATVEEVTPYHSTEVTYDLTIDSLHTYYVYAGDVPVLVHNCGGGVDAKGNSCDCAAENPTNWNTNSRPTFGHTFSEHGAGPRNTRSLTDRARSTGTDQGQWSNDADAAAFLRDHYDPSSGARQIPLEEGMGTVIKPDGSVVPATHAQLVPGRTGPYRTAFPIVVG
ncbi:polymorphic toxin-type HINT domain-containing protein [Amycolatopsis sp. cmx-4-83]|uniref:polymorphic toxin-type HINT domain-containing protein n=1 Tax=Amycolatopsis sp. cmx-4-83 TaxID=2790940 RepID=UPI00397DFE54